MSDLYRKMTEEEEREFLKKSPPIPTENDTYIVVWEEAAEISKVAWDSLGVPAKKEGAKK